MNKEKAFAAIVSISLQTVFPHGDDVSFWKQSNLPDLFRWRRQPFVDRKTSHADRPSYNGKAENDDL